MKNNLLYQTCHTNKNIIYRLSALEALSSLLLIVAAGILARLMETARQISQGASMEAAPALLVLLFVLSCLSLVRLRQNTLLEKLSHTCRLQSREKLHTSLFTCPGKIQEISLAALEAIESLDKYFNQVLPNLLSLLVLTPLMLASALALDILTAALFLITLPIAPFLLYLIGTVTKERTARQWQEMLHLTNEFQEMLAGIISLKIFHQEKAQQKRMGQISQSFATASLKVLQTAFISSFALELITTLSIAIVAVSIGFRLLDGSLGFETAFFLLLITPLYYQPLRQGGSSFHAAMEAFTAEQKITSLIKPPPMLTGQKGQLQIPPALQLHDLSLSYSKEHQPVFQGLNLAVPANCKALLTGPSGCGKSTLLRAAAGLIMPISGKILLNETDLFKLAPASRQKIISYLPQEPHIFAASLADNLSLFQKVPTERMIQALRLASLETWYHKLPKALDTPLGAGGLPLSQGEKKRLGLARIILQNRPLVMLDEPTNGLDTETEAAVLRALNAFSQRRTLLIVSHRPALKSWADKVFNWEELFPQEQTT